MSFWICRARQERPDPGMCFLWQILLLLLQGRARVPAPLWAPDVPALPGRAPEGSGLPHPLRELQEAGGHAGRQEGSLLSPAGAEGAAESPVSPRSRRESRRGESTPRSSGGWGVRARRRSPGRTKAIASLSRNMYLSRTGLHHCPGAQRFSTGAFRTSSASPREFTPRLTSSHPVVEQVKSS